jgi:hypothetical protein
MDCNSKEIQNVKNTNSLSQNDSLPSDHYSEDENKKELSRRNRKLSDSNKSIENASDEISHSQRELKNSSQLNNISISDPEIHSQKENQKEHISKVKKLPCLNCEENYAKQNLLKCYSCKELKCKECAGKETHNQMKKRDNGAYICKNCYSNKNEKNR